MDPRLVEVQKLLDAADGNLSSARTMIREMAGSEVAPLDMNSKLENLTTSDEGKVIEGVFDGEMMVAADGQTYPVPPNYASKSKLVEGDTLKLTISADGSFVFKQISPVERRNTVGTLAQDGSSYTISAEGKSYKVLTASVTFYKALPGDQVTIVLPKDHDAVWAVMENVIKAPEAPSETPTVEELMAEPSVAHEELVIPEPALAEPEEIAVEPAVQEIAVPETQAESNIESAIEPQLDNQATAVTPAQIENTPEIEFPSGAAPTISDEQLLENLKNNLKSLEQPAYTPSESLAPRPVDNIVASDLAAMANKQSAPTPSQPSGDNPIAELDI